MGVTALMPQLSEEETASLVYSFNNGPPGFRLLSSEPAWDTRQSRRPLRYRPDLSAEITPSDTYPASAIINPPRDALSLLPS